MEDAATSWTPSITLSKSSHLPPPWNLVSSFVRERTWTRTSFGIHGRSAGIPWTCWNCAQDFHTWVYLNFSFSFFKFIYLFWERERARARAQKQARAGEEQRERETENPTQALHCQHRAQRTSQSHEPWDRDLGRDQESDAELSLPGVPDLNFLWKGPRLSSNSHQLVTQEEVTAIIITDNFLKKTFYHGKLKIHIHTG